MNINNKEKLFGERIIDITSLGREDFDMVIRIAQKYHSSFGFCSIIPNVNGSETMNLYPYATSGKELPYILKDEPLCNFIFGWLDNAKIGPMPDTDGSCARGWRIQTGGNYHDCLRITPTWIIIPK